MFGRAKNGDVCSLEMVNNTLSQRSLWPDNHQLDTLFLGYFSQSDNVTGVNIQVTSDFRRAGITRSDIDFFNLGALS